MQTAVEDTFMRLFRTVKALGYMNP